MAVTLPQAALLSTTDLQRGVIETFVQVSPVLDRLPLLPIEGNAYAYNEEATLPGVAFRAVNEAYVESTGAVNQRTETLSILGGDADVDRFLVQTRGNLNDQRATQTALKVKAASYKFQDTFFNGDVTVDTKAFDGLKKRLIGGQVIAGGTNGIPVVGNGTTDTHAFFDQLDALLGLVPGIDGSNGAIYANSSLVAKIRSAGRRIGGAETVREDTTGKRILTWNGIPVLDPGNNPAGAAILPQNETQGSSSLASSIYAVKFGDDETDRGVTGLTNGGIQVDDLGQLQSQPVYRTRIEFYCGMAVFGGKAAARLTGVLNG
ncbi:major capsid protein [uncultured Microbacterium sp.]|uniref:major capsid protein n=1 Tax=uncultured Microbacterium sp. TaxID=191216 RepID=UPI0025FE4FCB|nr:hypothetical protein [uncultured Microbacterium sp.]